MFILSKNLTLMDRNSFLKMQQIFIQEDLTVLNTVSEIHSPCVTFKSPEPKN